MSENKKKREFVTKYYFHKDKSKSGRILESAKINQVYVSRVICRPHVVTGNYYHKETCFIIMVEKGKVQFKFVEVDGDKKKELQLTPGTGIVHVPPLTAFASRNLGEEEAVVVIFSNKPLRSGDDINFKVY